jgi:tRNA(fMet)-specific endonuclease VapC
LHLLIFGMVFGRVHARNLIPSALKHSLAGPIVLLPFDDEDSKVAGAIRAGLERSGKPIGAYDVLIAGQALQRNLTLVTANVSEFSRVKGLAWQDWAKT